MFCAQSGRGYGEPWPGDVNSTWAGGGGGLEYPGPGMVKISRVVSDFPGAIPRWRWVKQSGAQLVGMAGAALGEMARHAVDGRLLCDG